MSTSVIRVENLSKIYRLGKKEERPNTLLQTLAHFASSPLRNFQKLRALSHFEDADTSPDILWALRDISFEVQPGEVVGLIGRNGAGKSTLLKILSRIMPPSRGFAEIRGRMASLLEVGTGFHPELTGRENIYLNGTILGMRKAEITRKFDDIVAFSEIEKFIDTPVKRYSSGMYVRLAFAVAAHLEPEILIVDEVLAVGDAAFQQKCLGKMKSVSRNEGRTVIFVSHSMQAVGVLCSRVILLQNGCVTGRGPTKEIIEKYLAVGTNQLAEVSWPFATAPHGEFLRLKSVKVCNARGEVSYDQRCGAPVILSVEFWCQKTSQVTPSFHLYNQQGVMVFPTAPLHIMELAEKEYEPGLYHCTCTIPAALLNAGNYLVHIYLSRNTDGFAYVHAPDVVSFHVINDGTGQGNINLTADWPGVIRPLLAWTAEKTSGQLPK